MSIQFGIRVQADEVADEEVIQVTSDRALAEERLRRVRAAWPGGVLVQRTSPNGEWTEVVR
ncbi:hypothetical protein ACPB9J_16120 [Streptomyces lavendulocolor]|uniref:hypothetical protein n=1 Tax=Streptomyces lavendulocolor TaxID=67316 RepID=UPI003C2F3867